MNLRVVGALLRLERRQLMRERAKLLIMALLIALPVAPPDCDCTELILWRMLSR